MGIINITPDSFFGASRKNSRDEVRKQAEKMVSEGAAILDIGGQSTRPGAERVAVDEELERVIPAIETIRQALPDVEISVDTFYSKVAIAAVNAGASLVNDVSGGLLDEAMLATVGALQVPYVCMHMLGEPQTMQQQPVYKDVTQDVLDFFIRRIAECRAAGIKDIICDPGFGFGKTIDHNFSLLNRLNELHMLDVPLLIGLSRKSTIYKTLGVTPEEALNGTTVLHTVGLLKGAHILRVHDVKEAMEAIVLVKKLQRTG